MRTKVFFALILIPFLAMTAVNAQKDRKNKNKNKQRDKDKQQSQFVYETEDLAEKIPELKKEARAKINPYRYDASKVTYFIYKTFSQRKEIEVYFLNGGDYKMSFNSGAVQHPIELEIYDKPKDYKSRTLIYSKTGLKGSSFEVTSEELVEALKQKKLEAGLTQGQVDLLRLKKIYVNYVIPTLAKKTKEGTEDNEGKTVVVRTKGAMIMAMGYKNI